MKDLPDKVTKQEASQGYENECTGIQRVILEPDKDGEKDEYGSQMLSDCGRKMDQRPIGVRLEVG